MKINSLFAGTLCAAALGWASICSVQAKSTQAIGTEQGSGIGIWVSSDFDNPPYSGAVPLHLTIQNNSGSTGTWVFRVNSKGDFWSGLNSSVSVMVEAGKSRTATMVAPLFKGGQNTYMMLTVAVSGPGVVKERAFFPEINSRNGTPTEFLAMSQEVGARSFDPLKTQIESAKRDFAATRFDPADLAADWRGYAGIDWMVMSEPEWGKLAEEVRAGIRQWVGQGGHLVICHLEGSSFRISSGAVPARYGLGELRDLVWDGKELNPDLLRPLITGVGSPTSKRPILNSVTAESRHWSMLDAMGKIEPNQPLIIGFVIVFAVLIGPVNLFYFASSARRHRLFLTTPLLSLGGAFLLMAVIYMQEGTGGKGRRIALLQLLPDSHEAVVIQDQVTRTSLLLGSSFHLNEDALALPLRLDGARDRSAEWEVKGRAYSGNWFTSRTIQGHRIAAVRPTRASISKIGADASGAPIVISSIESPLETLFVTDSSLNAWRADNVRTGEKVTLKPVPYTTYIDWWHQVAATSMGDGMKSLVGPAKSTEQYQGSPLCFMAKVTQPKGELFQTLPSIRWKDDCAVYLGPVITSDSKGAQ